MDKIASEITQEKISHYFFITRTALAKAKESGNRTSMNSERADFIKMIECYLSDAQHFYDKKDYVNAFAAINYAHGWLDAGARLGLFDVHDSKLFTVD